MRAKYIKILSFLSVLLLSMSSCSDMDEVNTDGNKPTKVTSDFLCTKVLLTLTKYSGDARNFIAMNALPKYVAYATEGGPMAEQYNSLGESSFSSYSVMPNLDDMIKYAQGKGSEDAYQGIFHFSRAYMLYGMTMKMGDVPFSEANQANAGNVTPIYDSQEQNFVDILKELSAAQESFAAASGTTFKGDIFYDGNVDKWLKATNAFRLKVLMTLSAKTGVSSLDVMNQFKNIVAEGKLMTSNSDNLALAYANDVNKFHPLYNQQRFTAITIISSLMVDNLKALNDWRLFYFAEPSATQISAGLTGSDFDAYVGVDVAIVYESLNVLYNSGSVSLLNNRYSALHAAESYNLMTYAEQNLIIAEAIERGWLTGDAQQYYTNGVSNALRQLAVTDPSFAHGKVIDEAYIQGYFVGEAAYKSTKEDRLKQIWTQRYLLHFLQDSDAAFFENRRVNYPQFPINSATSLNHNAPDKIPVRWLYPAVERTRNLTNLTDALTRQFGIANDDTNNVMWLLNN